MTASQPPPVTRRTALPSVGMWLANLPIETDFFDFSKRANMPYFLENPDKYDKILISIGNFTDPFCLDDIEGYRTRHRTRRAISEVIDNACSVGKRLNFYLGGWHKYNRPAWDRAMRTGDLERRVEYFFEIFNPDPIFKCDFTIDATSKVYDVADMEARVFRILEARGAKVHTEARASRLSALWDRPSVTGNAIAASRLAAMPDEPEKHGVVILNSWFLGNPDARDPTRPERTDIKENLVPLWRSQGRPVYLPAHVFNPTTHEVPGYWNGESVPASS